MQLCNVCGKEIDHIGESSVSIRHYFGYESEFDGSELKMDVCAACADKLVNVVRPLCKFDPMKTNRM